MKITSDCVIDEPLLTTTTTCLTFMFENCVIVPSPRDQIIQRIQTHRLLLLLFSALGFDALEFSLQLGVVVVIGAATGAACNVGVLGVEGLLIWHG